MRPWRRVLLASLLLAACGEQAEEPADAIPAAEPATVTATPESPPAPDELARVNGQSISRAELDIIAVRTLGPERARELTDEQRDTLLDGAIKSRAMAILAEQDLSERRLREIDLMTAAYREELLAKEYLRAKVPLKPVTNEEVESFYNEHPELFGAQTKRFIAMLRVRAAPEEMAALSTRMNAAREAETWDAASVADEPRIKFTTFEFREGLLAKEHDQVIKALEVGETSPLHILRNEIFLFRVLDEQRSEPKPLAEVAGKVREMLLPRVLARGIEDASAGLMRKVSVERFRSPGE